MLDISWLFEKNLGLVETIGHTVKFIAMGIETKNFLINTGSFVVCALLIIIIAFGKYLLN